MRKYVASLLLTSLGFLATKSHAIDIDLSSSTATVSGQKIMLKQVQVPGLGTYNAEFTWDGAGSFTLSAATPSQPATSTGRTCRLTSSGGYIDITVKSQTLDLVVYSSSNTGYFAPQNLSIKQGTNSSQLKSGAAFPGYSFFWTSPDGFLAGAIPAGTQKVGQVTWTNTWFQPYESFSVIAFTGESWNC